MSREEFLRELEEALAGDVPEAVIRDNLNYYSSYLSQEMAKGRSMEEIVDEIGEPFIIAKTIIEYSEAVSETDGNDGYGSCRDAYENGAGNSRYQGGSAGGNREYEGQNRRPFPNMHYIDLNKWYWKLLIGIVLFLIVSFVLQLVGGIFVLLFRFAGPLMMFLLVYWIIKSFRR